MSIIMPNAEVNEKDEANTTEQADFMRPIKPIKEYASFHSNFDDVFSHPCYVFGIDNIASLIQHQTKLYSKEFPLPGYNKFPAKLQCDVNYDKFTLSITFVDEKREKALAEELLNLRFVVVLKRSEINTKQQESTYFYKTFDYCQSLFYNSYNEICAFSYSKNIKNDKNFDQNSIVLKIYAKNCLSEELLLDEGQLLWKVDVSERNGKVSFYEEDECGLSPFFYVDSYEYRAQVLLRINWKNELEAEVRLLNKTRCKYDDNNNILSIILIHPNDPPMSISSHLRPSDYLKDDPPKLKSCVRVRIEKMAAVLHFILKKNLLVKVSLS